MRRAARFGGMGLVLLGLLSCGTDGVGLGTAVLLLVAPAQATIQAGQTLPLSATLQDASGNPLPTSGVIWSSSDSRVASVSPAGVLTGLEIGGPVTITAIAGGLSGTSVVIVTSGAVSQLAIETQPSSTAQSGVPLGQQPVVQLLDGGGNEAPESGILVTAVFAEGQGTLINATATTDELGHATFSDLAIAGVIGAYRLRFESVGLTAATSSSISLEAGPATSVVIVTQPSSSAAAGAVMAQQPAIEVRDDVGNPVDGVGVEASIASGGGGLGGTTTIATTGAGRATFTDLSISGTPGDRTLQFQAAGMTVVSESITVTSGVPAVMAILQQPSSSAQSGVAFDQQPVVEVRDEGGNPTPDISVTAAVMSGGGTVGGTTTVTTDGSGVATFTDLSLTGLVGDRTLGFTAGAGSIESGTIVLEVGPPAVVTMLTQPSATVQSGVAFAQQPSVEVRDDGGNLVGGATVDVSIASGGGSLGGTTSVATDGSGQATFSGLSITGTLGPHALQFFAGSGSVVSESIDVTAGPPALMTILTQPSSSAESGVPLGQQPAVDVRDAGGNPAEGAIVTASIQTGGGTVAGETATVGASGVATFSALTISGIVGARTLRFTAGTAGATSGSVTLQAGPVAQLVITLQPSSSAPNAIAFAQQPNVRAQDDAGNAVSSVDITAVIQSGGGTLTGTTTVATSGSGIATFTNLTITGTVGARTLLFSGDGFNVTSNSVNLVAGDPASVAIVTQPPDFAIDGVAFSPSPGVQVQDVSGNPVPGQDVVATIAGGGGTLSGTTTVNTNGTGTATFSSMWLVGAPGDRTLQFSSNGEQATSDPVSLGYAQGTYLDLTYCGAQEMDVYMPSNTFARPLPVAAYIHGGGWVSGDKSTASNLLWTNVRDELLSRGYVVATLNYRLATPGSNKWPAQIHDVKCAVRHFRANAGNYGFDGVRIGVWGASAGGHLASMLGVTDAGSGFEGNEGFAGWSSAVQAAVPIGGISDLTGGPGHPELDFGGPEDTFNTWPGPSAQLTNASPITWASSNDPPFLVIHGTEDTTVFPAQATRLDDTIDAAGATSTIQLVNNGGHNLEDVGMGTPSPSMSQLVQQVANFLDAHVRFNP